VIKLILKDYDWKIFSPEIFVQNIRENKDEITIKSNFDYKRIQTLFSNLSSLSLMKLIELKRNYILINYSTVEISLQIHRILSYPIYLVLMTVFSAIIMLNTKKFNNNTLKISIGNIFLCCYLLFE
jgi:lipopolysaccharide export system permease protein